MSAPPTLPLFERPAPPLVKMTQAHWNALRHSPVDPSELAELFGESPSPEITQEQEELETTTHWSDRI